jgi:lipopolysaccharide transport system ATP-binding protein
MVHNRQYAVMASVAGGNICENVQHHWMHGALIVNVSSSKVRYGLVGISIEMVAIKVLHE